jgi:Uma2 family endonuclease
MNVLELASTQVRLIKVQEYHRMADVGILGAEERVELIAGQIWQMAAKGAGHSAAVTRCDRVLRKVLGDRVLVRLQDPIQLDEYSEPEPDIAVVAPDADDYENNHPTPEQVYLVIEVADTTLKRDLEFKSLLYAKAGIVEYWVLEVINRQIQIFRSPSPNGYLKKQVVTEGDAISLLAFGDREILVSDLTRKKTGNERY